MNNVGRGITGQPSALTNDDIDDMMRVNIKSALYGMQEILPHFQQRGSGHIIQRLVDARPNADGGVPLRIQRHEAFPERHHMEPAAGAGRVAPRDRGVAGVARRGGDGIRQERRDGGPDSRSLPNAQDVEQVGRVIAWVIETRKPDVYTFPGAKAAVSSFVSSWARIRPCR